MSNKLTQADARPAFREIEAYDADQDKMVTRSEDQQRQAAQLLRLVEMTTLAKAVALARIADGKHYLDLGHASFKGFAEDRLPIGYRSAKIYTQIGRKFAPLLPEFDPTDSAEGKQFPLLKAKTSDSGESDGEEHSALQFADLGLRKLRDLTTLDDADFQEVVSEGKIVMPDGETEYSMTELADMKAQEFSDRIEEAKMEARAYRSRVQQLEEEKKKLKAERAADEELVREADEKLEKAVSLEARYSPAKRTYEAREEALSEAQHHIREIRALVCTLQMDADTEQGLCNQLIELVREMHATTEDVKRANVEAYWKAEDTIEMDTSGHKAAIERFLVENGREDELAYEPELIDEETGEVLTNGEAAADEAAASVAPGVRDALAETGWHVQTTTDGGYELINEAAGYTTGPRDHLDEAIKDAGHIDELRADGEVPPQFRLDQ